MNLADSDRMENTPPADDETQRPPLFGSWRNAYFVIALIFSLEVGLFYFVSHYFE